MRDTRGLVPAGSAVKVAVVAAVLLIGTVGGAYALGIVGAPTVTGVENRFGAVNETTSIIRTDMTVYNPNPIGVRLGGMTVDYAVRMNDVRVAEGTNHGVAIGTGNSTLTFETGMNNSKIPAWWVSHVSNDEHTELRVDASVHSSLLGRSFDAPQVTRDVDTNVIGAFRTDEPREVTVDAAAVTNPVLILERTDASWGAVNEETTEVRMTLYLHNPKSYPITLTSVGYDITMNGVAVGSGEAGHTTTIPPGETVPVEATTHIDTQRLDEWWVSHLERNQVTELRMELYLTVDLSAAGAGERRVKLDEFTRTIETDVFGTKNATAGGANTTDGASDGNGTADGSGGGADGDATDTPTGTSTDASGDGGSTATPTGTASPTPGDGTTTTDDELF